jgi:hypothetical protein
MANNEARAARLREIARRDDVRFWYTRHAEIELRKDHVSKPEVENMLRRCRISLIETEKNEETLRAEGTDADGRSLAAIVVLYEESVVIKVVTGWVRE